MLCDSVIGLFVLLCWIFSFVAITYQGSSHRISNSDLQIRPKVFVIGLSRTGTTSLGDALEIISYRRTGWEDIRSRFLFRSYSRGDLSFLIDRTFDFDAFEDLPWSLAYKEMASLYPDAKFILTLRKSEDAWLESIKRHTNCRKWEGHEIIYGALEATRNEGLYLEAYRNHTDAVREFFSLPGNEQRLMEMVIDEPESFKGEKWSRLCKFLGLGDKVAEKMRREEFPWINAKPSSKEKHSFGGNIRTCITKMRHLMEEGLVRALYGLGWLTAAGI
jgi:hypothetical protein